MNEDESMEIAWRALLTVARDSAPELSEDLLRKAYAIQRTHQFDRERDVSLREMQRLLDEFIGQSSDNMSGGAA